MVDPTPFREAAEDLANSGRNLVPRGIAFDTFSRPDGAMDNADNAAMTSGGGWSTETSDDDYVDAGDASPLRIETGALRFAASGHGQVFAPSDVDFDEIAVSVIWHPGETHSSKLALNVASGASTGLVNATTGVHLVISPGTGVGAGDARADVFFYGDGEDYLIESAAIGYALDADSTIDGRTEHIYSMTRVGVDDLLFNFNGQHELYNAADTRVDLAWTTGFGVEFIQPADEYSTDTVAAVTTFAVGPPSRTWEPLVISDLVAGASVGDDAGVFTFDPNTYQHEEAQVLVDSTSAALADGTFYGQEYTLSAVATGTNKTFDWPANTIFISTAPVLGTVIGDRMSVTFRWNEVDWVEVSRGGATTGLTGATGATGAGGATGATGATGPAGAPATVVALVDGANIATNVTLGTEFTVTLGGDRTMDNPTNPVNGKQIIYRIKQDGTAPRLITWGSAFRFTGGAAPTLTNANDKTDYITFVYNTTDTKWDCVSTALNF